MKRQKYWMIALLAGLALAGCAKTPDQAVVREKSEHGVDGYQEDTEVTGEAGNGAADVKDSAAADTDGAQNEIDSTEGTQNGADSANGLQNDTGGSGAADENTETEAADASGTNALAQKLQAPERYQTSLTSADGKFKLECDADVYVPDVQKVPIYQVSQKEFSQEFIDRVTKAFFGDAPVYDSEYLYGWTKSEAEEKLNELKGYQAAGNLDPFGEIEKAKEAGASEEELEEISNYLQQHIDEWERIYAEAPETREKVEVHPGFANLPEDDENAYLNDSFSGYVETEDGNFLYNFDRWSVMPMQIFIRRLDKENGTSRDGSMDWFEVLGLYEEEKADTSLTEEEQRARMEEQVGITKEEAVAMADQYVERLGLADELSARSVILSRGSYEEDMTADEPITHIGGYGWQVDYTRNIDGFPVTDEMDGGGALESMESTVEPWCYEQFQITVNKDGLQYAEISNLYDVGERRMENVKLLPFPEIADIFEQMIQIKHADMTNTDEFKLTISHVSLGSMRVYDPTVDSKTGTLVPVWDFFGFFESTNTYEGKTFHTKETYNNRSFLTVNAADGTVIDRSLGY